MAWHACRQGTKVHGGGGELVTCPLPPTGTIPGQDPDPQPTPDFTGLGHLGWGGGGGGTLLKPRSTFMHMGAGQGGQCTEYRRWSVQGWQGLLSPTVCCTHLPLRGQCLSTRRSRTQLPRPPCLLFCLQQEGQACIGGNLMLDKVYYTGVDSGM